MKLNEIRSGKSESEQAKEYRSWLAEWIDDAPSVIRRMVNNDGTAHNEEIESGVAFMRRDSGVHHLKFPMKKDWWTTSNFGCSVFAANPASITIDDFKNFPDCAYLNILKRVSISSFEGIESNKTKQLIIHEGAIIDCGLLRLLKMPNLETLKFETGSMSMVTDNKKLRDAIHILNQHLKSVPDCMDALIEAGLKEYAKL
jgi:hypothetical protein